MNLPSKYKSLGSIPFASAGYGQPDLFAPNGGLSIETLEGAIIDVSGLITVSGGTLDGTPTTENPDTIIKAIEVQLVGSALSDPFISIPMVDLVQLNKITERNITRLVDQKNPVVSGAVGAYAFRGIYRLPFCLNEFINPYIGIFPIGRTQQVKIRIKWGTTEDLIQGGDRTEVISACTATIYSDAEQTGGPWDTATDLWLHQRVEGVSTSLSSTANTGKEVTIPRTGSFLRGILLRQMTVDSNGVETPVETLIRATDPVTLFLGPDRKFDTLSWEILQDINRRNYGTALSAGHVFLDMAPRADIPTVMQHLMTNFNEIKIRFNNASVANGVLRCSLLKYSPFA